MTHPIQLLDTVALISDLPEVGLTAGEVGAVVEVLSDIAVEVEFVDDAGQTYGLHAIKINQLVPLHKRGNALRLATAAA